MIPNVCSDPELNEITAALDCAGDCEAARAKGGVYAIRNLLEMVPAVRRLAEGPLRELAAGILGEDCFAVRGILFDKRPEANWLVPWHQDLTIAVAEKLNVEGFGPWTEKAGIPHVQPPATVMEAMLAVRLHLDDCSVENGPVRVLAGSHRLGRLSAREIEAMRASADEVTCTVPRGGVLLMRPLLLHSSSPATSPNHRRVIHIEYAATPLPGGLRWQGQSRN